MQRWWGWGTFLSPGQCLQGFPSGCTQHHQPAPVKYGILCVVLEAKPREKGLLLQLTAAWWADIYCVLGLLKMDGWDFFSLSIFPSPHQELEALHTVVLNFLHYCQAVEKPVKPLCVLYLDRSLQFTFNRFLETIFVHNEILTNNKILA